MYLNWGAFAPPLILAGLVALVSAVLTFRRRRIPSSVTYAALMLLNAVWCFAYALELGALRIDNKLFWTRVEYVSIAFVPILWLTASLQYTSWGKKPTHRQWVLLCVIPAITFIMAWTNDLHGLIYESVAVDTAGDWSTLSIQYGPWFWVHTAYSYLALMGGSVVLVWNSLQRAHVFRRHTVALVVGVALPWISNVIYLIVPQQALRFDPTPIAITASAILADLAMFRLGFLDIVPAARNLIVDGMRNALLVLDQDDRIIDLNPAAERLLQRDAAQTIGQSIDATFYDQCYVLNRRETDAGFFEEIRLGHGEAARYYDLRATALARADGQQSGRVLTLHDVTDRRKADVERERLITELQQALDEVETLSGLLPICASCKRVRDDAGYWRQLEEYLSTHANTEFTHGICPDCLAKIYPELVDQRAEQANVPPASPPDDPPHPEHSLPAQQDAPAGPPSP